MSKEQQTIEDLMKLVLSLGAVIEELLECCDEYKTQLREHWLI